MSKFTRFVDRSPEMLTLEDVRTYQVDLASKGVAWASLNQTVRRCGSSMASRSGSRRSPNGLLALASRGVCRVVLSAGEVVRFLEAVHGLKARAALTIAYAAGCACWRSPASGWPTSTVAG